MELLSHYLQFNCFLLQIILPLLFFALLWWLLIRQAQSANNNALSFGKSRAKPFEEGNVKITFADVAGVSYSCGDQDRISL